MTLPTAFDDAGIRMVDSIREIFDIIGYRFEAIEFSFDEYRDRKQLVAALKAGKCPVMNVPYARWNPEQDGSQAMLATGIKSETEAQFIQLKNSMADNPNEQGIIRFNKLKSYYFVEITVVT